MFKWIRNFIADWRERRAIKKRLKDLKKRDPFIY